MQVFKLSNFVKFKIKEKAKRQFKRKIRSLLKLKKVSEANNIEVGLLKGSGNYDFDQLEAKRASVSNSKSKSKQSHSSSRNVTLVEIGAINEFGSPKESIPERSFLRSTVKEHKDKYRLKFKIISEKIIKKPQDFKILMGKLGQIAEDDVKAKIRDLREPPNSPKTIKLKGSDNPLIDTGQLRQAIRFILTKHKKQTGRG